jgi:hypothetical protein
VFTGVKVARAVGVFTTTVWVGTAGAGAAQADCTIARISRKPAYEIFLALDVFMFAPLVYVLASILTNLDCQSKMILCQKTPALGFSANDVY